MDVLSRNQLRREGFKFECDSETDTMTTPQGGTVDLVEKDGLPYLMGDYQIDSDEAINSPTTAMLSAFLTDCRVRKDSNSLINLLKDPGLSAQKHKHSYAQCLRITSMHPGQQIITIICSLLIPTSS